MDEGMHDLLHTEPVYDDDLAVAVTGELMRGQTIQMRPGDRLTQVIECVNDGHGGSELRMVSQQTNYGGP